LIYASLGTLQNSRLAMFRCFAQACEGLDAQLVITHGGGLRQSEVDSLPPEPIVVDYAPQLEILSRARLTLSHAGLNTVLDSLSCGVPVVAVPLTYEQPAIAERLRYIGAGEVISARRLDPNRLRLLLCRMLQDQNYLTQAGRLAQTVRDAGGVRRAADIILAAVPQVPPLQR
jgi:MGT family glycosyltransferase